MLDKVMRPAARAVAGTGVIALEAATHQTLELGDVSTSLTQAGTAVSASLVANYISSAQASPEEILEPVATDDPLKRLAGKAIIRTLLECFSSADADQYVNRVTSIVSQQWPIAINSPRWYETIEQLSHNDLLAYATNTDTENAVAYALTSAEWSALLEEMLQNAGEQCSHELLQKMGKSLQEQFPLYVRKELPSSPGAFCDEYPAVMLQYLNTISRHVTASTATEKKTKETAEEILKLSRISADVLGKLPSELRANNQRLFANVQKASSRLDKIGEAQDDIAREVTIGFTEVLGRLEQLCVENDHKTDEKCDTNDHDTGDNEVLQHLSSNNLVREIIERAKRGCPQARLWYAGSSDFEAIPSSFLSIYKLAFELSPNLNPRHGLAVAQQAALIVNPEAAASLRSSEIALIIAASLCHEAVAMQHVKQRTATNKSPESTDNTAPECLHLLQTSLGSRCPARLEKVLLYTCMSTCWDLDELSDHYYTTHCETLSGETLRPAGLAGVLRLANLIEFEHSDKPNSAQTPHNGDRAKELTSERYSVAHFERTDSLITAVAVCATKTAYKEASRRFAELSRSIEHLNTYVFRDDLAVLRVPPFSGEYRAADGASFELRELHFEIDDDGRLWDVLRRSLYTGRYDYIRELISNATDACIKRMFDDELAKIPSPSPRTWSCSRYEPQVVLVLDEINARLIVADNGIGMDQDQLEEFLFKIACRGRASREANRGFSVPTIGKFGVGFISVLTRASQVVVATNPTEGSKKPIRVEIETNLRDAILEQWQARAPGTRVLLSQDVDVAEGAEGLFRFIGNLFRYPHAKISCISLRRLEQCWSQISALGLSTEAPPVDAWRAFADGSPEALEELVTRTEECRVTYLDAVDAERRKRVDEASERHKAGEYRHSRQRLLSRPSDEGLSYLALAEEAEADLPSIDFLREIPAAAPKELPISTPVGMMLDNQGAPHRITELENAQSHRLPTDGITLLYIPLEFDDYALGVEWRSIHGFAITDNTVAQSVAFGFTLGGSQLDADPVIADYLDSRRDVMQAIAEQVEDGSISLADANTIMADRLDRLNAYEIRQAFLDVSAEGIFVTDDDSIELGTEGHNPRGQDVLQSIRLAYSEELIHDMAVIDRLSQLFNRKSGASICQDGIRIPVSIRDVAPIGAVAGNVNLMGQSRFSLNVTRANIDENPSSISKWKNAIATAVLGKVAARIVGVLNELRIDYSPELLWTGEEYGGNLSDLDLWCDVVKTAN